MAAVAKPRFARREHLGLAAAEFATLARLTTPAKIQAFLNAIPANHEPHGETIHSVRAVLAHRCAHCIEGALLAACALWVHGEAPLVMHLDCDPCDFPHVVALFRHGAHWGAISKTNGSSLRFRDPVYRSLRELAMSYFHEYCDRHGRQTLRSYSAAFDLRRLPPQLWVTNEAPCTEAHDRLAALRHYPLVTGRDTRRLVRRDAFEQRVAAINEHPPPERPRGPRKGRRHRDGIH